MRLERNPKRRPGVGVRHGRSRLSAEQKRAQEVSRGSRAARSRASARKGAEGPKRSIERRPASGTLTKRPSPASPRRKSSTSPARSAQIKQNATARRQQTARSAATVISSGPAVAAARFGVSQAAKRLPKARDVPGGARKALDFGSRAVRTSGKSLSRWWSGY